MFFYILLSSSEHAVTMFHYSSPHFSVEETETHRSEFSPEGPQLVGARSGFQATLQLTLKSMFLIKMLC